MVTDDVYYLLNAAQGESSPTGSEISVTGSQHFVAG